MNFSNLCLGLLILSAASCKQNREIKVYRVAKETSPAAPQPASSGDPHAGLPGVMPGGAMPSGPSGDPHAGLPADQMAGMRSSGGPQITDSPPDHWKKMPPTSMRQASYLVEGEGGATVDISLVILRGSAGGALENVNRWRGQLGQPAIDEATLKQTSKTVITPVGEAVVVEIEGLAAGADPAKDGSMVGAVATKDGDAWFYKMRGNSALTAAEKDHFMKWMLTVKPAAGNAASPAPVPSAVAPSAAPAGDGSVSWQLPDGWAPANGSSARYATIAVTGANGAKGELAVTHFPGDVGGDLANVNRWRGQIGLEPIAEAALAPAVTKITAGSKIFQMIDATGPQNRCAAGWARHGADTWFFKLTGPDALVGAEKAKFTAFLESVRFNKPE